MNRFANNFSKGATSSCDELDSAGMYAYCGAFRGGYTSSLGGYGGASIGGMNAYLPYLSPMPCLISMPPAMQYPPSSNIHQVPCPVPVPVPVPVSVPQPCPVPVPVPVPQPCAVPIPVRECVPVP
ncbi:unnamed protein product, partial [Rotaria sordida]